MHSAKQMSHFEQVHENSCLFFQSVRVLFISTTNPKQLAPVFLAPVWCPLIALTKTFFAYSVLYFVLINLSSTSRYLCICCCTRILFMIVRGRRRLLHGLSWPCLLLYGQAAKKKKLLFGNKSIRVPLLFLQSSIPIMDARPKMSKKKKPQFSQPTFITYLII